MYGDLGKDGRLAAISLWPDGRLPMSEMDRSRRGTCGKPLL